MKNNIEIYNIININSDKDEDEDEDKDNDWMDEKSPQSGLY